MSYKDPHRYAGKVIVTQLGCYKKPKLVSTITNAVNVPHFFNDHL